MAFVPSSLSVAPASMPMPGYASGHVTWSGAPAAPTIVTITFRVTLSIATTRTIVNTAQVAHGSAARSLSATVIANPRQVFLPLARL